MRIENITIGFGNGLKLLILAKIRRKSQSKSDVDEYTGRR